jgi:hypothetical protein
MPALELGDNTPDQDPKRAEPIPLPAHALQRRPLSTRDPVGDPIRCGHYGHRRKGDGQLCVGTVVKGTDACRMHGGRPVAELVARGTITEDLRGWGLGDTTADPGTLYLRLITQSAARVDRYAKLLRDTYEAAEQLRDLGAAGAIVLDEPETRLRYVGDEEIELPEHAARQVARQTLERVMQVGEVAALIGHVYSATKDGDVYATGEAIRALVKLEQDERRFLADMCQKAVAAGLAKQRVDLASKAVDKGVPVTYVLVGVDDEALR